MDSRKGKKITDINELLAMAGSNLNILEEEVDINVQREYFDLLHQLGSDQQHYQELCKQYGENINDLFDPEIDEEEKKKMLVILATVEDVAVYRTIENFSKQKSSLRKWGIIALQQSRMLLQSTLSDDPGVFISTGLGGHGLLLRYFCVFLNRIPGQLQDFQKTVVKNETEAAVTPFQGKIEKIHFTEDYITMLILLPINIDLQPLFTQIIDECNQYGNFLLDNMLITNVKKWTDREIKTILKMKSKSGELPA